MSRKGADLNAQIESLMDYVNWKVVVIRTFDRQRSQQLRDAFQPSDRQYDAELLPSNASMLNALELKFGENGR